LNVIASLAEMHPALDRSARRPRDRWTVQRV